MVIHWTVLVVMENSRIRVGKVMFIEVSIMTPQKDISPVAMMAPKTLGGIWLGFACCGSAIKYRHFFQSKLF